MAQQWKICHEGYITHKTSDMCVDLSNNDPYDGAKIHLWSKNGSDAQKWAVKNSYDRETFTFRHKTGRALDLNQNTPFNGAKIHLWSYNGTGAQQWVIYGDGTIRHAESNMCLDLNENKP